MVKKERTFTIKTSCINVSGGRYKSSSPAGAAKKAANRLYKKSKSMPKFKNIKRITFTIRETTSGSNKDEYNYKAAQVKLAKPLERVINGVKIVNRFKVNVEAMKSGKEMKKKSKIKCNKKDASFFGGQDPPEEQTGPTEGETDPDPEPDLEPEPKAETEPVFNDNTLNNPLLGSQGGAKKRRYKQTTNRK